jgi:enterochelin esterase-like enzyme
MSCGTEDFLLEPNRSFHQFLTDEGVEHVYEEDKGGHDMVFWNKYIERFIPRMFGE